MSTTVTYKGSTLTSFTNTTKTLKTSGKYMEDDVIVTESISLQSKTATPTESTQTITPGTGYEGLSQVTVGAISSNYVGSNIPVRTEGDLTTSASTITTPAGYYSSSVSKSIEAGTATTPATTITTNPAISVNTSTGLITASYSGSSNVTPTIVSGYVSQGTAGKISTAGNVTYQLTSQPAQTITPSTSNQTIASGIYLTGSQTILGDINLIPSNIKSGVSIFGVQGNIEGGNTFIQDEEDVHGGTIRTITTNQMVSGISVITSNGLHTVASYYSVSVSVTPALQSSTVTPTETAVTISPGTGYTGFSQVTVNAISSNYVGTNVPKKSASDLTAVDSTVTVPSGYYSSQVTKNVSGGSAFTPAITITTNPWFTLVSSTGKITAAYNGSSSITPTITSGYISNGTAGIVSTTGTSTYTLTTQGAQTITPTESVQTIASYRWLTGTQTIAAISSNYIGSNVPTKSAANLTANNSTVTVPSGYYSSQVTKNISGGNAFTPAVTITTNPTVTLASATGVITASYSGSSNVTPTVTAGYISTGTAGTISTAGTITYQLTLQAAQTITPTTTNQYINSYRWLTGSQTIKGDTNLVASNIAEGVSIFGVMGTHSSGITPTGTYSITSNGIYDVTNFASVNVSVDDSGFVWQDQNGYINLSKGRSGEVTGVTVDDIAVRTISGDIAGNASIIYTYAFYHCSLLTTASFPSATSIGASAFQYCYSLNSTSFPNVTSIGAYAFAYCSSLTTASFPSATYIGGSAFYNCTGLTTVSFPSATSIGTNAFQYCYSLNSISFPNVTSISTYAFRYCSLLTTASFPNVTSIGAYAFAYCSSLTTASFPSATYIGGNAFASCWSLTTVSFPSATSITNYAFQYCSSLTTASFPNVTYIGSYAFASCWSLTTASFPNVTSISTYAFQSCYNLLSLYLLGSSVCTLSGTSTFYSTPIGGRTTSTGGVYGSIFVPSSLYNNYIVATNWASVSSRFVSLTDAEIEALSD